MKNNSSLYKRVLELLDFFHASKRACAKEFGINQKTLGNNLSDEGEKNLWQHLPKILEMYPRVSRQWLYFGEGPMLIGRGVPLDQPIPVEAIADAVGIMAKEAGGTNAALYHYIAGLPLTGAVEGAGRTGQAAPHDAAHEILELLRENRELRKELDAMKKAVPAENFNSDHAVGGHNAAHMQHEYSNIK